MSFLTNELQTTGPLLLTLSISVHFREVGDELGQIADHDRTLTIYCVEHTAQLVGFAQHRPVKEWHGTRLSEDRHLWLLSTSH